ncbi:beta-propeller fold lactonase family protein [Novosphingobium flavum]|uniref:Beta-propeller fold lactonase family protein n=1 Tax=Novosphingobium flavum TaxID=1778672 RepID=A0A7X1KL96_9SPHN|nr:beta-propeller fold lactonase family protein [Novosphingobium flavum]MBC2665366.1 beta-propeller fold lactonase family protein [Novosphingobium flavum]
MSSPTPSNNASNPRRVAIFNSVGNVVTRWELDAENGTLERRASIAMPSVVQYGWPHPSGQYLYVTSTDSERGSMSITGSEHYLLALKLDDDGGLSLHGEAQRLRQRAVHNSVDGEGRYALTCYTAPSHVTVHPIRADGTLGQQIEQGDQLDLGFFCHQVLPTPSNRSVVMAFRGHNPSPDKPDGIPGSLKVLDFADGQLTSRQDVMPFGKKGYGYGPRHVAFHPAKPWVYVVVELQNELHMHQMIDDRLSPEPLFTTSLIQEPAVPGIVQIGGAIHVHPRGHVVYASNRVSAKTSPIGAFPFDAGENSIAVFAIDQETGEPKAIQFADPHGFHVRCFTIDPSGTVLIAATLAAMSVGTDDDRQTVPAGLSLFRIADDGRLTFLRRYDIDLEPGVQQMWVRAVDLDAAVPSESLPQVLAASNP